MLKIVSVAFLDYETLGADQFFVQINDSEVMLYEANRNTNTVEPVIEEPTELRFVTASIEKFNNMYRVDKPVELARLDELVDWIGKFEIVSETSCTPRAEG